MQKYSFSPIGWWPFLLGPLLLLLLFGLFQWRAVEHEIAANAELLLATPEFAWAGVETYNRGRDLLITGVAPGANAVVEARQRALQAAGVRRVDFAGEVAAPLNPAELAFKWDGEQVFIAGKLNNQASIDMIIQEATAAYGARRVVNQLILSSDVKPAWPAPGLFSSLTGLGNSASVSIVGDQLILKGEVKSATMREALGQQIGELFPGEITNLLAISAPPKIEIDQCQELIRELLDTATINFEVNIATIKADSFALLADVAETAKRCPDAQFEVAGHTDGIGDLALNMALSKQRAEAVVKHLAGLGLNIDRFTAEGYGPKQPVATNQTAVGRAQNRRIEFNIRK